ncbi:hypothetical protein KSX_73750 [Ktedonospora formicarum]|uniref:Lanthionine synthetase C-like protein n=1 Tax=Ktedonospora formicarum TaxID=2778364 RepID=A0A8J3MUD2_9CHLR|nr:hypothetical protein KSX_73750 [Ktedonospora formicarum]
MQGAIERWSTWLIKHHLTLPWGRDWPSLLPTQYQLHDCVPSRTAWCYGTPGIARTLWLAGQALGREDVCIVAREALAAVLRRPARQRNIDDPQICHGMAGLLLICLRFAYDDAQACSPWLQEALPLLMADVFSRWKEKKAQMEPGFLTGAVGGALTLIAALTSQEATWDQVLLLS